jgi:hypothetical protein
MRKLAFFLLFLSNLAFAQTYFTLKFATTNEIVHILYRDCFNEVLIDVPSMPDSLYFPIVTVSNGTIKPSEKDKRKFLVVPSGNNTILSVSNQFPNGEKKSLGKIELKVCQPPKGSIMISVNNKPYEPNMSVKKGSVLKMWFAADEEFSRTLPKEARYTIGDISIFAQNGNAPKFVKTIPFDVRKPLKVYTIPLPNECFLIPDSKIYVECKVSGRLNAKNELISDAHLFGGSLVFISK